MQKGLIVSIQGYSSNTTQELTDIVIEAGAVAIRTDKPVRSSVPIIGLHKVKVADKHKQPYITPTIEDIQAVMKWAEFVAIDFRTLNKNLEAINKFCVEHKVKVVADLEDEADGKNILDKGFQVAYVSTTFSVFKKRFYPDKRLLVHLLEMGFRRVIGEGNYQYRNDVKWAYEVGAGNVCIGGAISNIYKLTRKYVV